MSETQGQPHCTGGDGDNPPASTPQEAIRKNLNSFLNPGLASPSGGAKPADPKRALQLHMAQMELANRLRLQASAKSESKEPKSEILDNPPQSEVPELQEPCPDTAPPAPVRPVSPSLGFAGGPQAFQMSRPNFGQKPTASRLSPYQKILANATNPQPEPPKPAAQNENSQDEILAVPEDAEVKVNEAPKRLRGKKFRNPSL